MEELSRERRNLGKEELALRAREQIIRSLILDKVAEVEGITVGNEEVEAEVERMAQGERGEEIRRLFSSPQARDSLRGALLVRKTLSYLVETCGRG
jgi:FKBP-type peptidyl-prolyl cis-trans isomerase (trigger factor)